MIQFAYITAPSHAEAKRISRLLVQNRLAACANIFPPIQSVYWWKGKIEFAQEYVIIAKTRKALMAKLIRAVEETHPYETPCVLALDINQGNKRYLKWILNETKTPKKSYR